MATNTCGCNRVDNVFLPCVMHKKMQEDADALNSAIINQQTEALRKERDELLLQNEELQKKLALVEKMNADNAKMRGVYLHEKEVADRLIREEREFVDKTLLKWINADRALLLIDDMALDMLLKIRTEILENQESEKRKEGS